MRREYIGDTIGALGVIIGAFLGLLPWLLGDDESDRIIPDVATPTRSVAEVLAKVQGDDVRRIINFGMVGLNNSGLIQSCLHNAEDEQELAAYQSLEKIGLGTLEVRAASQASPHMVQADGPDEDGDWWAMIGPEMLESMCMDTRTCRRSFSFVPSDLGIEVRTYLRNLLVFQIDNITN
ncbi:hypothetical protein [Paracoccus chinensis]|uniref:hypothetical protein n=1 Tax=Paracoccus chinensis TaxID=525640 RepID=UPI001114226D|nr:hypothetical protein [Paracoccus chinensis]